ncbi:thiamine phosphate synthase [Halobacillus sp. KGW1]|uniref:thiamine phosphate synthase n=1 Tax=Halobacillus sp. KGW1 TaxID=1793726 RepID=UPI0007819F5A|nr:thiamine phosphate synthase [Halobacillus sp. KGW1]
MKLFAVTKDEMDTVTLKSIIPAIDPYVDTVIYRDNSKSLVDYEAAFRDLMDVSDKWTVHKHSGIADRTDRSVHYPERCMDDLKVGTGNVRGVSVHSLESGRTAQRAGADYVLFGHIFQSDSKRNAPPRGISSLMELTGGLAIPVFAIGGIQPQHISLLRKAGAAGVAVQSGIFDAEDPISAAENYREAILS